MKHAHRDLLIGCALAAGLVLGASAEVLTPYPFSAGAYITETVNGRTVWTTTNSTETLGFKIPSNFVFTAGQRVTIEIEYLDKGAGRILAEYDSNIGTTTADKNRDAEIHTRSSRVGTGAFVKSYQVFESPLFAKRQTSGTDFRFKIVNGDDSPLQVAAVNITNGLFAGARLQYAASRPWLGGYTGPTAASFDNDTLDGKIMTGYQGWFRTPNDWDDSGWTHWIAGQQPDISTIHIDMWPYLDGLSTNSLYRAGNIMTRNGHPAYLFSSTDQETVRRHFRWMRKHNIDGAYLQRFVNKGNSGAYGSPEFVLQHVREAANLEGRIWAIEYDISSLETNATTSRADRFDIIVNDWKWLVDEVKLFDDPRYARHNGKPVVFIWGFSSADRDFTPDEATQIINFFKNDPVYGGNYLIGGGPNQWRNYTEWYPVYQLYDEYLAWMQKDAAKLALDKTQLDSWGVKQLPHIWPGFSWHNLQQFVPLQQYTDRAGGQFYWDRIYNALNLGSSQLFAGMFDEYDEGTAIMPMSDDPPVPYSGWGYFIDNQGNDPEWYLRLTGTAKEIMQGKRSLTATVPAATNLPPSGLGGPLLTIEPADGPNGLGLTLTQPADGLTHTATAGGKTCITNIGRYFYFNVDDQTCFADANGRKASVEIEYYDAGSFNLTLQYDALTNNYKSTASISVGASNIWKTARWTLSDAYFGNRQNGLSDFRLAVPSGKQLYLRRVTVTFAAESSSPVDAGLRTDSGSPAWPETSAAQGWRLFTKESLTSTGSWFEVVSGIQYTNGLGKYNPPAGSTNRFFRLLRHRNE